MERSPADVLRFAVALTALLLFTLVSWLFGDTLVGFTSDLLRGLDALPDWLVRGLAAASRVLAVVVLVGGLIVTVVRTGRRMLGTMLLAAGIAVVLVVLLADFPDLPAGDVAAELDTGLGPLTSGEFPRPEGIAALAAALTASAPWLSRTVAPLGLGRGGRSGHHPVPHVAGVVRLGRSDAGRLARRGGSARRPRSAVASSHRRRHP